MKRALDHSDVYNSIVRRLGTALVAQDMISQYMSVGLSDNHWALEAERLFVNSLARIQFDALNIASGEDRAHEGEDGWVNDTPDEAGNLCGLYKFQSVGYTNIYVWIFGPLFLITPILWIFNIEIGAHRDDIATPLMYWILGKVWDGLLVILAFIALMFMFAFQWVVKLSSRGSGNG